MYIFISHSSQEAYIAKEMCDMLEKNGNRCFLAPRDIRSGYEYAEEIANGIDDADAVLLLLSEASNTSPHVLREVERAVSKAVPILVYKLEDVVLTKSMEYFLMTHQWMERGKDSYRDVLACVERLEKDGTTNSGAQAHMAVSAACDANGKSVARDARVGQSGKNSKGIYAALIAVACVLCVMTTVNVVLHSKDAGAEVSGISAGVQDSMNASVDGKASVADIIPADIALGDTITMGVYQDEPINWRVLHISEDGSEAVLVAEDVLTVKAFDAPESGWFNHDGTTNYAFSDESEKLTVELAAYVHGNSSWETSSIRTWLNSDRENVTYEGGAPTAKAMADGVNAYNDEKGFLCNFTEEELALIKTTTVETKGNALSDGKSVVTQDRIFLLSMEELTWFEEADVALLTAPTAGAIANNQSSWYQAYCVDYGVNNIMWWLRDPVEDSASLCYHEENVYTWEVGVESFGIRPAMVVEVE